MAGSSLPLPAQEPGRDGLTIPTPETFEKLTQSLKAYPDGATPPATLASEVTAALEAALELDPEGELLPKHLDTLALAAAPHPQWHGILLRLTTRLKARITKYSSYPEWFAVGVLAQMLAQGTLVPDVDLHVVPAGPGKVAVSWTLPGLLIPDAQPAHPRYLPWPVLASSLAGKFDAVLSEEPFGGGRTRILKRWKNLPATEQIILDDLPSVGQIRMNLRSLDHPDVMVRCRLAGYNSLPVLMDTAHPPPGLLPPAPEGLEWLAPPQSLTYVPQWQVSFNAPLAHADGRIWMVLLDQANGIVGVSRIQFREGWPGPHAYHSINGSLIRQSNLMPDPAVFRDPSAPLQTGGSPSQFALARSIEKNPSDAPRPIPPITVQDWPFEDEIPVAGRLKAIRVWQQTTDEDVKVAVGGSPLSMAWYRAGKLTLCEMGEHAIPQVIDLPVPSVPHRRPWLIWQGRVLRVFFTHDLSPDPAASTTTLITVSLHPDRKPTVQLLPHVLSSMPTSTKEDDPLLLLGLRSHLLGLLPAEGLLRTLQLSENHGLPLVVKWQLSPTESLCEGPQGSPGVVLDWSDNVLKIREWTPNRRMWSHPNPNVWNMMLNGRVSQSAITPRRDWTLDVGTHLVWPIADERAYGTMKNAVVLYKLIPTLPLSDQEKQK